MGRISVGSWLQIVMMIAMVLGYAWTSERAQAVIETRLRHIEDAVEANTEAIESNRDAVADVRTDGAVIAVRLENIDKTVNNTAEMLQQLLQMLGRAELQRNPK